MLIPIATELDALRMRGDIPQHNRLLQAQADTPPHAAQLIARLHYVPHKQTNVWACLNDTTFSNRCTTLVIFAEVGSQRTCERNVLDSESDEYSESIANLDARQRSRETIAPESSLKAWWVTGSSVTR